MSVSYDLDEGCRLENCDLVDKRRCVAAGRDGLPES